MLFLSLAVLASWPSAWPIGIILGLGGLTGLVYEIKVIAMRHEVGLVLHAWHDWLPDAGVPALGCASLIVGAVGLMAAKPFAPMPSRARSRSCYWPTSTALGTLRCGSSRTATRHSDAMTHKVRANQHQRLRLSWWDFRWTVWNTKVIQKRRRGKYRAGFRASRRQTESNPLGRIVAKSDSCRGVAGRLSSVRFARFLDK